MSKSVLFAPYSVLYIFVRLQVLKEEVGADDAASLDLLFAGKQDLRDTTERIAKVRRNAPKATAVAMRELKDQTGKNQAAAWRRVSEKLAQYKRRKEAVFQAWEKRLASRAGKSRRALALKTKIVITWFSKHVRITD